LVGSAPDRRYRGGRKVQTVLGLNVSTGRLSGESRRVFRWRRIVDPTRLETSSFLSSTQINTDSNRNEGEDEDEGAHTIRLDCLSVQSPKFHEWPMWLLTLSSWTHHDGQRSSAIVVSHLDRAIEKMSIFFSCPRSLVFIYHPLEGESSVLRMWA
jgi:hypothetical protein